MERLRFPDNMTRRINTFSSMIFFSFKSLSFKKSPLPARNINKSDDSLISLSDVSKQNEVARLARTE
ncbi:MAG: hypothetical protein N3G18_09195, partial [Candidatus Saccharicenans sp.]|nr:hypothetical protein [Candidatus Saccharicenans sp.]